MIFMAPETEEKDFSKFRSPANEKLMQYFLRNDIGRLQIAAAPGNSAELHIGKDFHGYYDYIFSKKEFVISPKDNKVRFALRSRLEGHTFEVRSHCCTRPDLLIAVKITKPGSTEGDIANIEFEFKYEPGLLILIGLFILVTDDVSGKAETILCDPQVGSGPP